MKLRHRLVRWADALDEMLNNPAGLIFFILVSVIAMIAYDELRRWLR